MKTFLLKLYEIVYAALLVICLPFWRLSRKGYPGFLKRFGAGAREFSDPESLRPTVWLHAVSVGEVGVLKEFVELIRSDRPDLDVVISTVTATGLKRARQLFPDVTSFYAPFDTRGAVRAYLRSIRPVLYVAAETEIWPVLFDELHKNQVPVVLINGRISDRSWRRYRRVRNALKNTLATVRLFCVQSQDDAKRLQDLGAEEDRTVVTGNMKFDCAETRFEDRYPDPGHLILIGGSTHPGEERLLLNVYRELKDDFPRLRLILAPRHVERAETIAGEVEREGFRPLRYSRWMLKCPLEGDEVLVVDTIGDLKALYVSATLVVMGKTFLGIGGQNMIEPAMSGRCVILGPHTENFRDVIRLFEHENAFVRLQSPDDLTGAVSELLRHPDRIAQTGEKAAKVVRRQQGASLRAYRALQPLLPPARQD